MRAWGAAAATVLALVALPTDATAKPGFSVEPAKRWSEFSLPATNGYRVTVSANAARRKASAGVYVTASKGQRDNVQYLTHGHVTKDGAIKTTLPGVGRIAVRFSPTKVTREAVPDNCKGPSTLIRHGLFRGTIELHGELGYTTLHSTRARGKVSNSFRQVCDQRETGSGEGAPGVPFHQRALYTGAGEGTTPTIGFFVSTIDLGSSDAKPFVYFTASSSKRHDGLHVFNSVSVQGTTAQFSTPDPAGTLENATVAPPAPFQGSATFHLDSPTSSSWLGTLGVEIPGVGEVGLAGAGFWSSLCEDLTCTHTLPPNVQIITSG
jgi:hypothetical protein